MQYLRLIIHLSDEEKICVLCRTEHVYLCIGNDDTYIHTVIQTYMGGPMYKYLEMILAVHVQLFVKREALDLGSVLCKWTCYITKLTIVYLFSRNLDYKDDK